MSIPISLLRLIESSQQVNASENSASVLSGMQRFWNIPNIDIGSWQLDVVNITTRIAIGIAQNKLSTVSMRV